MSEDSLKPLPSWVTFSGALTEADWESALAETDRLTRELDITNADHIALWLEANMPDSPLAWLACRIAEAHERERAAVNDKRAELAAVIRECLLGVNQDDQCVYLEDSDWLLILESLTNDHEGSAHD